MAKREYDPLSVIPTAATIQHRLREAQEHVRRLRVLLKTAQQIERNGNNEPMDRSPPAPTSTLERPIPGGPGGR